MHDNPLINPKQSPSPAPQEQEKWADELAAYFARGVRPSEYEMIHASYKSKLLASIDRLSAPAEKEESLGEPGDVAAKKTEAPQMALSVESRMEPKTDFRFARDVIAGIDTAYKDYIRLLKDEINDLVGLARVHGWRSRRVEDGKLGRERIANALALWQTEVDWHEGRALDSLDSQTAPSVPSAPQNQPVSPGSPKESSMSAPHSADVGAGEREGAL